MHLDRLKNVYRELGMVEGTLYLATNVLRRVSAGRAYIIRYHLVAQPVPQGSSTLVNASAKSVIRHVTKDDPIVATFPRPPAVIAKRFADGATCLVAEVGGRFAGFLWLAHKAYEEDEVRCRYELVPAEQCAWDYDVYVEPDFRIGRTFSRLWTAANTHLAEQGVRWSLSRISAFNPTSLAAHKRLGIRRIDSATFIVLGRWQISLLGQPPFLHVSGSSRRPILQLRPPVS
jgi:hypothetical protein